MRRILLLALVASFIFWGCNNDDSSSNVGILSVRLSDSPADYEAVLIDVMELHINVFVHTGTSHKKTLNIMNDINPE